MASPAVLREGEGYKVYSLHNGTENVELSVFRTGGGATRVSLSEVAHQQLLVARTRTVASAQASDAGGSDKKKRVVDNWTGDGLLDDVATDELLETIGLTRATAERVAVPYPQEQQPLMQFVLSPQQLLQLLLKHSKPRGKFSEEIKRNLLLSLVPLCTFNTFEAAADESAEPSDSDVHTWVRSFLAQHDPESHLRALVAVSYTHLTLPTILLV